MSVHIIMGDMAWLSSAKAIVSMPEPKTLYVKPEHEPKPFEIKGKKYNGIVFWGERNDLPKDLAKKVRANPITAVNSNFNAALTFGGGVVPVKRDEKGKLQPYYENQEINAFLEDNDINGFLLQQAQDLWLFRITFPEIILNREAKPKIVEIHHKKATFSRLEVMDKSTAQINHHFYSALWGEQDNPEDIIATPYLSPINPIKNLKYRVGIETDPTNRVKAGKDYRFVLPVTIPSPDTFYYPIAPWTSVLESGWYDFAQAIPTFKRALLNNGMVLKYHVEIHPRFFPLLFQKMGITGELEKEQEAKNKWLNQLNEFLSNPENAGKTFVSEKHQVGDKMESMVTITQIKNEYTGGEYLPDLEEASNILSYAFDVHPSLVGSSPGKNKNINGTEARELFIIKQAMMSIYRNRLLFPLNVVKAINGWPADVFFTIPNLELTTLDKGTGAEKSIGQPAVDEV